MCMMPATYKGSPHSSTQCPIEGTVRYRYCQWVLWCTAAVQSTARYKGDCQLLIPHAYAAPERFCHLKRHPCIRIAATSAQAMPRLSATQAAPRENSVKAGSTSFESNVKLFTYTAPPSSPATRHNSKRLQPYHKCATASKLKNTSSPHCIAGMSHSTDRLAWYSIPDEREMHTPAGTITVNCAEAQAQPIPAHVTLERVSLVCGISSYATDAHTGDAGFSHLLLACSSRACDIKHSVTPAPGVLPAWYVQLAYR